MKNSRVLVELVPKNENEIMKWVNYMQDNFNFDWINLPNLKPRWKVNFMSPEEIWLLDLPDDLQLVSHLRTQDSNTTKEVIERVNNLLNSRANEILLVTWDSLSENSNIITTWKVLNDSENVIPNNIWVSADLYMPNWWRFNDKLDFLKNRKDTNIYTQPVFSSVTLEDIIKRKEVLELDQELANIHIWVTFITTPESRKYWEKVNNIPLDLLPKWDKESKITKNSISISRDIFNMNKELWFSTYIMLIRSNIEILLELENKISNISEV